MPTATHTSTPAPTRTSTATPTTFTISPANLRQGPSIAYPYVGQVHGAVEVVAQSPDLQWLQLANDAWIYKPLVAGVPDNLPIATGVMPTPRPRATPTKRPTPTPTPQPSVNTGANLRGGPGIAFPIVGGLPAGSPVEVKARTESGDWLQLASGAWIAAFLIDNAPPRLPIATNIPAFPTPTFTPVPVATPTPTNRPRPTTPPIRPTAEPTIFSPITQTQSSWRCDSETELDYLLELYDIAENADKLYAIIGDHYRLVSQHPGMLNNKGWIESTYAIVDVLVSLSSLLEGLNPSSSLMGLHILAIEMADKLLTAAAAISLSMEEDIEYLKVSSTALEEALVIASNMATWIDNNC